MCHDGDSTVSLSWGVSMANFIRWEETAPFTVRWFKSNKGFIGVWYSCVSYGIMIDEEIDIQRISFVQQWDYKLKCRATW